MLIVSISSYQREAALGRTPETNPILTTAGKVVAALLIMGLLVGFHVLTGKALVKEITPLGGLIRGSFNTLFATTLYLLYAKYESSWINHKAIKYDPCFILAIKVLLATLSFGVVAGGSFNICKQLSSVPFAAPEAMGKMYGYVALMSLSLPIAAWAFKSYYRRLYREAYSPASITQFWQGKTVEQQTHQILHIDPAARARLIELMTDENIKSHMRALQEAHLPPDALILGAPVQQV